jgi:hypothetical protein
MRQFFPELDNSGNREMGITIKSNFMVLPLKSSRCLDECQRPRVLLNVIDGSLAQGDCASSMQFDQFRLTFSR